MSERTPTRSRRVTTRLLLLALVGCASVACAQNPGADDDSKAKTTAMYETVDCLLPPQMIVSGEQSIHFTPSRPVRTSEDRCAKLGGARKAGLAMWRQLAEAGNVDAQVLLGEMYENGFGGAPQDTKQALDWYGRAAKAGNKRAISDLAMLYDHGAPGLPPDSAHASALVAQTAAAAGVDTRSFRVVPTNATRAASSAAATDAQVGVALRNFHFGNFKALLIGNGNYQHAPKLNSPTHEVDVIGKLLETRYGFKVDILKNATYQQIMSKMDNLEGQLTEDDNFLLYFTGHGDEDSSHEGFWIPVDGEAPASTGALRTRLWISSADLRDRFERIPARHILVIADSCYSARFLQFRGELDTSDVAAMSAFQQNFLALYGAKTRVALTSGGLAPVTDGTDATNLSVFSQALIKYLQDNQTPIPSVELFSGIDVKVLKDTSALGLPQQPQWGPMSEAGHESGDFWFVPR